jgi:para-aminobenzoate synthetase component 1
MLSWANQFNIFCFLDNRQYDVAPHKYECLLGAGANAIIASDDLQNLDVFLKEHPGWKFGHLSYDLKDSIYFPSGKEDIIGFARLCFFVPQFVLFIKNNELNIIAENSKAIYKAILNQRIIETNVVLDLHIQQRLTQQQYIEKIKLLQEHILKGDCYEINFCQEFFCENAEVDPLIVFQKLMEISPSPFAALHRMADKFLICASPERFLQKSGSKIISQPMKGTAKRNLLNTADDEKVKEELRQSKKDQSENVMVVDLVRNDLTKICKGGSVKVEELFGVYSYPQVHQMISTISGELQGEISLSKIWEATFPMGSMTGAPKYRVMQLIDECEEQRRGIFSGSVGYISPENDFDFNVVIRSIMYNATKKYLSYQVGSGITFYSDPEKEWEECLLKGEAIKKVLGSLG